MWQGQERDRVSTKKMHSPNSTEASKDHLGQVYVSETPQFCPEHHRVLDFCCLEPKCQSMICASCALFGIHKSHKVKEEKDLAIDAQTLAEEVQQLSEYLRGEESKARANEAVKAWVKTLAAERVNKEAEIKQYFEGWRAKLQELEEATLASLKQQVDKVVKSVNEVTTLSKEYLTEVDSWTQRVNEVLSGNANSSLANVGSPVLQLYLGLTNGHMGTSFPLKNYGHLLYEGISRFITAISSRLEGTHSSPSVEYEPILNEKPVKISLPDPTQQIKEAIEAVIKEERKKLLKGMGKDRVKEDDLLNTSHLGMSLLTLTDNQNTSRDFIEPETHRILDDNLLNFEDQYKDKQPRPAENLDFTKSKKPRADIYTNGRRMFSGDKHTVAVANRSRPLSRQETINRNEADKLVDYEYCSPNKSSKDKYYNSVKTDVGKFSIPDAKGTFGDFFGSWNKGGLQGPMTIQNMTSMLAAASVQPREDSNSVRRAAEILRRTADCSSTKPRGASVHSQNSSIDSRPTKTELGQRDNAKNLMVGSIKPMSTPGEHVQLNKSELKSLINSKKHPTQKPDTPSRISRDSGKSPAPVHEADSFLTAKATELLKTKMSHKSIPTKFHPELFKLMDSKSTNYDFSDSQMGDAGVHFLSKYIRENSEIDQLKLDNCKITDDGLSILLWSMYDIKIDKLYLRDNHISKLGVEKLFDFVSKKKNLSLVNLKSNPVDKSSTAAYIKEFSVYKVILLA